MRALHSEKHRTEHIGWLRAAVLGANDGIVSTASLVVGVAAANATRQTSWSRASRAWLPERCRWLPASTSRSVLSRTPKRPTSNGSARNSPRTTSSSTRNWRRSMSKRGLDESLAKQVAQQLMANDALAAHARDELGISESSVPGRFKQPLLRPEPLRSARRCRC